MSNPVRIVGVLNVTPDSFYDGGKYDHVEAAVVRAQEMIAQGAAIIEIGGESTGPNSKDISAEEELSRVLPVLQKIQNTTLRQAQGDKPQVSVDTYKSEVAEAAIAAGAGMINDVTAGRGDARMFAVMAKHPHVAYVMMYSKDPTPRTTVAEKDYVDVVQTVGDFLVERRAAAVAAGMDSSRIIFDTGLGHFISSKPEYSYTIIEQLPRIVALGQPVLLSPSRKSFLAGPKNLPASERLPATLAASVLAAMNGASYIRTHDVAETQRALSMLSSA